MPDGAEQFGRFGSLAEYAQAVEDVAGDSAEQRAEALMIPEEWAARGQEPLTSLLIEGFLIADAIPREPYGTRTEILSGTAERTVMTVEARKIFEAIKQQVFEIPEYFFNAKNIPGYVVVADMGYVRGPGAKDFKPDFLRDPKSRRYGTQAERGLASMIAAIGYMQPTERPITPSEIARELRRCNVVDSGISLALETVRQDTPNPAELFPGVLEMTRLTAAARQRRVELARRHHRPKARLLRGARRLVS